MQNRFHIHLEQIASVVVRVTAAIVGFAIFFGDVFFWTKGDIGGHFYSSLSLLALLLAPVAVSVRSHEWKHFAAALVAFHFLATIAQVISNNTWSMFSLGLMGIDLLLFLVVIRGPIIVIQSLKANSAK